MSGDEAIGLAAEPAEIEELWRSLAEREAASPKVWSVAAVAMAGRWSLVTFDRDFRRLESAGLDLLLPPACD